MNERDFFHALITSYDELKEYDFEKNGKETVFKLCLVI